MNFPLIRLNVGNVINVGMCKMKNGGISSAILHFRNLFCNLQSVTCNLLYYFLTSNFLDTWLPFCMICMIYMPLFSLEVFKR